MGETTLFGCSPDGKWLYGYDAWRSDDLTRYPTSGAAPELAASVSLPGALLQGAALSADGETIAAYFSQVDPSTRIYKTKIVLFHLERRQADRPLPRRRPARQRQLPLHSADSARCAALYPRRQGPGAAPRRKRCSTISDSTPGWLAGHTLTDFKSRFISDFRWSRDGRAAVLRHDYAGDVVLLHVRARLRSEVSEVPAAALTDSDG